MSVQQDVNICQSCSMPMRKADEFGSNADGGHNSEYCCYCFQKGSFTWPDATIEQFSDKLVGMASKMGMAEEQARKMASTILPQLKRWRA